VFPALTERKQVGIVPTESSSISPKCREAGRTRVGQGGGLELTAHVRLVVTADLELLLPPPALASSEATQVTCVRQSADKSETAVRLLRGKPRRHLRAGTSPTGDWVLGLWTRKGGK
jgi:hypothetical protein